MSEGKNYINTIEISRCSESFDNILKLANIDKVEGKGYYYTLEPHEYKRGVKISDTDWPRIEDDIMRKFFDSLWKSGYRPTNYVDNSERLQKNIDDILKLSLHKIGDK